MHGVAAGTPGPESLTTDRIVKAEERSEYEAYVLAGNVVAIFHAKAKILPASPAIHAPATPGRLIHPPRRGPPRRHDGAQAAHSPDL